VDVSVLRRKRTRRELLAGAVRLGAGAAAVVAFGPQVLRPALAEEGRPARVKVLIEDVTEETAAAFARGRASAVEIIVEGGRAALRGTAGGEFTSGILALPFPATHLGLHWVLRASSPEAVALAVRGGDGRRWSAWQALEIEAVAERAAGREVFAFLAGTVHGEIVDAEHHVFGRLDNRFA